MTTLDQVAEISGGGTPSRANTSYFGGDILWATPTDVTALDDLYIERTKETLTPDGLARSSAKLLPAGAVLLTSRATIGFTAVSKVPISTNQGFVNFVCGPMLQAEYLAYWLRAKKATLERLANGATFKEISRGTVRKLEIDLPDRAEQRRIVDLLSHAENIVRMRREAEKKAKEIIPALFLEMFGDPGTNPKGWPTQTFRDIGTLDRGRSRHRPRDASHLYGGPHPFVQTGDVARSGGVITTYAQTYSDAGLAQSKLWPVGTLCITIAANIAETGVLAFEACFPDSVVGFLPGESVQTDYIQNWLHFLKPTLAAQAPQAAQKNINLEILRNLNVPIPPMSLQVVFEKNVKRLRSTEACQLAATAVGDQVFQSLLAGMFSERVTI